MKKLELKHLAGYLPYGLKMKYNNDFVSPKTRNLSVDGYQYMVDNAKPILHPLSDLTKYCKDLGFIPITKLYFETEIFPIQDEFKNYFEVKILFTEKVDNPLDAIALSLAHLEKLYEWHFDIHGLIENGLAIDINKLKP